MTSHSNEVLEEKDAVRILLSCENGIHEFNGSKKHLCKSSDYFRTMFTSGFVESLQNDISMSGVTASSLEALIKYSESGSAYLKMALERNLNVSEILQATKMLLMPMAEEICCEYLLNNLTCDKACDVLKISELHSCEDLFSKTLALILASFETVHNTAGFLELPYKLVKLILEHENLNLKSELTVFEALCKWIEHDTVQRYRYLPDLIQTVIVANLSSKDLSLINESALIGTTTKLTATKIYKKRVLPLVPSCVGRYKNQTYIYVFDEKEEDSLKPYLSLVG